jgi:plasmid stabilization system protein ParE
MLPYEFDPQAISDIAAARDWYEQHGPDLGNKFFDEVLRTIRAIRQHPEAAPEIESGVRATRCGNFSYRMYFRVVDNKVQVLAVYHTARDPKRWNKAGRQ